MLGMRLQKLAFDQAKIQARVARGNRQALTRGLAFVRTRARSSLRKRKVPADPGAPPSSHVGTVRNFLLFALESDTSGVVGVKRLSEKPGTAPRALEGGGFSTLLKRNRPPVERYIRRHPYLLPALQAELPNLPGLWAGVVRE